MVHKWDFGTTDLSPSEARKSLNSLDIMELIKQLLHTGMGESFNDCLMLLFDITFSIQGTIYSETAAANYDPRLFKEIIKHLPMRRLGTTEEVCMYFFKGFEK